MASAFLNRGALLSVVFTLSAHWEATGYSFLSSSRGQRRPHGSPRLMAHENDMPISSRRELLWSGVSAAAWSLLPSDALAEGITDFSPLSTTLLLSDEEPEPCITDKIFLTIKGLPARSDAEGEQDTRIVIGLYGQEAPQSVGKIKALVSNSGLPAPCRPKAERTLQKEQLEANKVYKSCKEGEDIGVSWHYSTVWRVIPNLRIDLGAVTGRFVAREYPEWAESTTNGGGTGRHAQPGIVSVRRGNDSGFGISITTGGSGTAAKDKQQGLDDMDKNCIVVGKVLEGMNVVQALNQVPVITTAKQVNYMAIAGGNEGKNAPTRSCQYGGPLYCNEYKPLVKLTVTDVGVL